MRWIHFYIDILQKWFQGSIVKFSAFSYLYFARFTIRFICYFLRSIKVITLSSKIITHAYLLKILTIHNKKQNPILNVVVNYISARSVPQILYIKGEYTFRLWNFLVIGLCNSSANSWFLIFSFIAAPPEVFLSKN